MNWSVSTTDISKVILGRFYISTTSIELKCDFCHLPICICDQLSFIGDPVQYRDKCKTKRKDNL